jgi:hypothetical protein
MQKSAVDFTATNEVTASLQAQLDGKIQELLQLQGEQLCRTMISAEQEDVPGQAKRQRRQHSWVGLH